MSDKKEIPEPSQLNVIEALLKLENNNKFESLRKYSLEIELKYYLDKTSIEKEFQEALKGIAEVEKYAVMVGFCEKFVEVESVLCI